MPREEPMRRTGAVATTAILFALLAASHAQSIIEYETTITLHKDTGEIQRITFANDVTTFTVNGTTMTLGVASLNHTMSWNTSSPKVNASELPEPFASQLNLTLFSAITQRADRVYEAVLAYDSPLVSLFGFTNDDKPFVCDEIVLLTRSAFECHAFVNLGNGEWGPDPNDQPFAIGALERESSTLAKINVFVFNSTAREAALSVAMSRSSFVLTTLATVAEVPLVFFLLHSTLFTFWQHSLLNQERRADAKNIVIGVYVMMILAMIGTVVVGLPVLAWTFPLTKLGESVRQHIAVWGLIILAVIAGASIGGGLPGWIACGIVMGLMDIGLGISYGIIRRKAGKLTKEQQIELSSFNNLHFSEIGGKESRKRWSTRPRRFGRQAILVILSGLVLFLLAIGGFFAIVYVWKVQNYYVMERATNEIVVEIQPPTVSKSTLAIYSYDGMAVMLRMNFFFDIFSDWCGTFYTKSLTDEEKEVSIYQNYVALYEIDMSEFEPSDWRQYDSLNDWFIRPLKAGSRSISQPNDDSVVISPADARLYGFPNVPPTDKTIIKEEEFSVAATFNNVQEWVDIFADGTMLIVRLAPQDYHHFHAPVSGTVVYHDALPGTLYSVNSDAVRSDNNVLIRNMREIVVIRMANGKHLAFIAVGATCVGSIKFTAPLINNSLLNVNLTKGEPLGYFQFGGSTIVLLFPPGEFAIDNDLLDNTEDVFETYVHMGTRIARTL